MEEGRIGYEDLEVWKGAVGWASRTVTLCNELETGRKHYSLIEQLEWARISVAMNTVEGKGRYSKREFVRYLCIARGSLYETLTLLEICMRQGWVNHGGCAQLRDEGSEIPKMLNALAKSIKNSRAKGYTRGLWSVSLEPWAMNYGPRN
jgi:four helix bundle protein